MRTSCEQADSSGGEFLLGLITGVALGATAAVLLTPKPGSEMRQDVTGGIRDLGQAAKEGWGNVAEAVSSVVDKGRDAFDEARKSAQNATATPTASAG